MDFVLTAEIISQIIFAMEDQQHRLLVDRRTGELVRAEEAGPAGEGGESAAYVPVPDWRPIDGFNLMERFTSRLRNPFLRSQLRDALASRKGVFRRFKDILKGSPEVERLWFTFKEREMRRLVWEWYNQQRELAHLERLPVEPDQLEDNEELILTDFAVRPGREQDLPALLRLDRSSFVERFPQAVPARVRRLYRRLRARLQAPLSAPSVTVVAETPQGGFAGFLWALRRRDTLSGRPCLRIVNLAVSPEYRGLGIGALLLREIVRMDRERGWGTVRVTLAGQSLRMSEFARRQGFTVRAERLELDVDALDGPG